MLDGQRKLLVRFLVVMALLWQHPKMLQRVKAAQRPQGLALTRRSGWHPTLFLRRQPGCRPAQRRAIRMVLSLLAPLQTKRERVRAELSVLVEQAGGKMTVDGFGRLDVSRASFHTSYDRKQLEAVILKLIDAGHYHLADAIRSCKKESARPGTLRILRDLR